MSPHPSRTRGAPAPCGPPRPDPPEPRSAGAQIRRGQGSRPQGRLVRHEPPRVAAPRRPAISAPPGRPASSLGALPAREPLAPGAVQVRRPGRGASAARCASCIRPQGPVPLRAALRALTAAPCEAPLPGHGPPKAADRQPGPPGARACKLMAGGDPAVRCGARKGAARHPLRSLPRDIWNRQRRKRLSAPLPCCKYPRG